MSNRGDSVSRGAIVSYCFCLQPGGDLGALLTPPLRSVRDAVDRYAELRRLFEGAPRCPQKSLAPWASEFWKVFYCVDAVGVGEKPSLRELDCGSVKTSSRPSTWR